jgi:hypothetical protein
MEVGVAYCGFLSSLSTVKKARIALLYYTDSIKALSHLAVSTSLSGMLQFAALDLLTHLAPYVSCDGPLTANGISEATATLSAYRAYHSAICGLAVVFDSLSAETQEAEASVIAALFMKNVKSCIVARSTTRDEERAYAAELSFYWSVIRTLMTRCSLRRC